MTAQFSSRRSVLKMVAAGAAGIGLARAGSAQTFPSRPISIIVPFAPGGSDVILRLFTPKMAEALGTTIVVENISGASGLIGSEKVARAEPDGYTLLNASSSAVVTAPLLYKQVKFDVLRDFTPIGSTTDVPLVLFVHPSLPVNSVQELIDYVKPRPNEVAYGSVGNGSVWHLNGESFNAAAGVKLLHVPYRGLGAMMNDTLAGRVQVGFSTVSQTLSHITGGKLRALAILDNKPSPFVPGVPAATDTLPSFRQSAAWSCLLAPVGLPESIQTTLYRAMSSALVSPEVRKLLDQNYAYTLNLPPAQTLGRLKESIDQTRELIRVASIETQ